LNANTREEYGARYLSEYEHCDPPVVILLDEPAVAWEKHIGG